MDIRGLELVRDRVPTAMIHEGFPASPSRETAAQIATTARQTVVRLSFWGGVILPLVYIPLLVSGVLTQTDALLIVGFLVTHAGALLVGHGYSQ